MILQDRLRDYNIILASGSPRRRELLADSGFSVSVADKFSVDETSPEDMDPTLVPEYLSIKKSNGYPYPLTTSDILITADTIVILEGQIIGKPTGRDGAISHLRRLSGRRHTVVTGVTLRSMGRAVTFSEVSEVEFREFTDEEIAYYVDTYSPLDKAGAYGIQEWIGYVGIRSIVGTMPNIMGLPMQKLYIELEKFIS